MAQPYLWIETRAQNGSCSILITHSAKHTTITTTLCQPFSSTLVKYRAPTYHWIFWFWVRLAPSLFHCWTVCDSCPCLSPSNHRITTATDCKWNVKSVTQNQIHRLKRQMLNKFYGKYQLSSVSTMRLTWLSHHRSVTRSSKPSKTDSCDKG